MQKWEKFQGSKAFRQESLEEGGAESAEGQICGRRMPSHPSCLR